MHHAVRRRRPPPRNFLRATSRAPPSPLRRRCRNSSPCSLLTARVRPLRSFDKQAKMKKNTCGKTSFDSFDGMTCVEEPASGKWVCQ